MAAKTKRTSNAKKTVKPAGQVPSAPAPVAKPPAAAPVVASPAPAAKPAPAPATKAVSAAERAKLVEVRAYLIAEKNGFKSDPKADWLQAEKEIDAQFGKK